MSQKSASNRLEAFRLVPIEITVRIGRCQTTLSRLAKLEVGDQILLDRSIGEPFDLLAEGRHVAHVEPIACEDAVAVKLVGVAEEGA